MRTDLNACGLCTLLPDVVDVTEADDPTDVIWQCQCIGCGMAGPKSPHEDTAVFVWNRITLGEPSHDWP